MNTFDFERIVHDHERRLYAFARRIVGDRQDAEEVVQDAFLRAHRALSNMPASGGREIHLKPWLYTITLNVARNRLRRKHVVSVSLDAIEDPDWLLPLDSGYASPDFILDQNESFRLVEDALLRLPAGMRATARLRFIEGRTNPEIAEIFHQPVGTVKSNVHRAALILRRIIAEEQYAA
jgi:RNA polymerase sigma-70 factor (ECF subfamily)